MDNVPLCKNCVHWIERDGPATDRCRKRTLSKTIEFVRGDGTTIYAFCDETRDERYCGRAARWFESRAEAFAKKAGLL